MNTKKLISLVILTGASLLAVRCGSTKTSQTTSSSQAISSTSSSVVSSTITSSSSSATSSSTSSTTSSTSTSTSTGTSSTTSSSTHTSSSSSSSSSSTSTTPIVEVVNVLDVDFSNCSSVESCSITKGSQLTVGETSELTLHFGRKIYPSDAQNIYVYVNDARIELASEVTNEGVEDLTFTFTVPSIDVEIKAYTTYNTADSNGYSVTFVSETGGKCYGIDLSAKYSYVSFYVAKPLGKKVISYKYQEEGSDTWTDCDSYAYNGHLRFSLSLTTNITIQIEFEEVGYSSISYTNTESLDLSAIRLPENADIGSTVTILNIKVRSELDTYLSGITHNLPENANASVNISSGIGSISFTMPSQEVVIDFSFAEKVSVTCELAEGVTSVQVLESMYATKSTTSFIPGSRAYVALELESGAISNVYLNGTKTDVTIDTDSYSPNKYYISFTVPEYDVVVTYDIASTYSVSLDSSVDGVSLQFPANYSSSLEATPGETVEFVLMSDNLTTILSVGTNVEGLEITCEEGGYYGYYDLYSFVMPSENVTIIPVVQRESSCSVTLTGDPTESSVTAFNMSGQSSYGSIFYDSQYPNYNTTTATFKPGEKVTFSLTCSDASKKVAILFKDANGNTLDTILPVSYDNYMGIKYYYDTTITIPEGLASVSFSTSEQDKFSGTFVNNTDLAISLFANGSEVTELTDLYAGTAIVFKHAAVPEGQKLVLTLTDSQGNSKAITGTSYDSVDNVSYPAYVVSDNFTITASLSASYTLDKGTPISYYYGHNFVDANGATIYDSSIEANSMIAFKISWYGWQGTPANIKITITVGEEVSEYTTEWTTVDYDTYYITPTFEVTGNVSVSVSVIPE